MSKSLKNYITVKVTCVGVLSWEMYVDHLVMKLLLLVLCCMLMKVITENVGDSGFTKGSCFYCFSIKLVASP